MSSDYTRWYRTGTVTVTKSSKNVVGVDTYWASAGMHPGDMFTIDGSQWYEVAEVVDNTHLTLKTNFLADSKSSALYSIVRNFTSSMQAESAARTADLVNDIRKYIDTDMQSIHGKSAYEIAVSKGYVGTEEQWLESLKAGGELAAVQAGLTEQRGVINAAQATANSALNTAELVHNYTLFIQQAQNQTNWWRAGFHNSFFRGRSLGDEITEEQWTEIRNGTFNDMYVGDYWVFPDGQGYFIAHFDYYFNIPGLANAGFEDSNGDVLPASSVDVQPASGCSCPPHHIVIMPFRKMGDGAMNTTDTKGEFYGTCHYRLNQRRQFISTMESYVGAEHLMYWSDTFGRDFDTNYYGARYVRNYSHYVCQAELPNTIQLTGQHAIMHSGLPSPAGGKLNEGRVPGQFAAMRHCNYFIRPSVFNSTYKYAVAENFNLRDVVGVPGDHSNNDSGGCVVYGAWNQHGVVWYANPLAARAMRPYFCLMG